MKTIRVFSYLHSELLSLSESLESLEQRLGQFHMQS